MKSKDYGLLVLTFKKDKTFEVDYNADGERDIWGRFELLDNRIKFIDDKPRIISDCYEAGFYYYKIEGNELNFDLLADQCKPRKEVLNDTMVRLSFGKKPLKKKGFCPLNTCPLPKKAK